MSRSEWKIAREPSRSSIARSGRATSLTKRRVAREHRPGLLAAIAVDEGERGVLGSVPGRVERPDQEVADLELEAVIDRDVLVLGLGLAVDVDRGAGRRGESSVTGYVVGVVVGLEHVLDRDAEVARELEVLVDLELRIDDSSLARALVADEVGGAAEVVVDDLTEDHLREPPRLGRRRVSLSSRS